MIKTKEELLSLLVDECCIEFLDGTAIGTSPGIGPLRLYLTPEDDIGEDISNDYAWEYFKKQQSSKN